MFRIVVLISIISCTNPAKEKINVDKDMPNILWLVAEDMSPVIPSFGDSTIKTPNLNRLAREGVRYTNFYSTHGVCAPSRAAIATGLYPATFGANHMRTGGNAIARPEDIPAYEAIPPPNIRLHGEELRRAGYYTTNNAKTDYQFRATVTAWDENGPQAHWRNRQNEQPFFSIFNFGVCHESGMWRNADKPLLVDPAKVIVPPYYPDNQVVRNELARMYSNVIEMDRQVGEILDQLEEDDLLDKTVIFWYTDHGGPLPRQKRELYDSGIKVPLIIRFPGGKNAGMIDDQMLSFIDLKPTIMSVAGVQPDNMHGEAFLGKYASSNQRRYIHAARDRLDTEYDIVRAVRDERYKYIRNYETDKPNIMNIGYRKQMKIMQELYRLDSLDQLVGPQKIFFNNTKPEEELYDCHNDPFEVNNLAMDPAYDTILSRLRMEHESWESKYVDDGLIPETELIAKLWPEGSQPQTEAPTFEMLSNKLKITSKTPGASIGFRLVSDSLKAWSIYTEPITINSEIEVLAHRIGFLPSQVINYSK